MNHADLAADLPFYATGTLDAARRAEIEAELATCERCAIELRSIETLRGALHDAEREPLETHDPEALLRDVFARIDSETPGAAGTPSPTRAVSGKPLSWLTLRTGGALAAAFALAIGAANQFRPHDVAAPVASVAVSEGARVPAGAAQTYGDAAPVAAAPPALARSVAMEPSVMKKSAVVAPGGVPQGRPRMLARDGSISLIVEDVGGTIARVQRLAIGESGVLTHLDDVAPAVTGARHTATLTIGVPEPHFDATMAALASYGTTVTRAVRTEDLTGAIVDGDARLRNLRREEADLLKIMDRSGKISDVLDVEQQLASTRQQIEELAGESKAMHDRVADATIVVSLSDAKTVSPVRPGVTVELWNSWGRSVDDVRNFTVRQLGRLFEIVAFAPYLLVLAAIAYAVYRRVRRGRSDPPGYT